MASATDAALNLSCGQYSAAEGDFDSTSTFSASGSNSAHVVDTVNRLGSAEAGTGWGLAADGIWGGSFNAGSRPDECQVTTGTLDSYAEFAVIYSVTGLHRFWYSASIAAGGVTAEAYFCITYNEAKASGYVSSNGGAGQEDSQSGEDIDLFTGTHSISMHANTTQVLSATNNSGAGAGGYWSVQIIRCIGDFNRDDVVDFSDYLDFVDAFSENDESADVNGDSVVNFFDYLDFIDRFSAGC